MKKKRSEKGGTTRKQNRGTTRKLIEGRHESRSKDEPEADRGTTRKQIEDHTKQNKRRQSSWDPNSVGLGLGYFEGR
ncbi:Rad21 / Rec8 like protein, partial [Trichinella spiralis]|uniref:Rad21 / Rec8 like protein n=1 Tax=Trichinella spiralis TaxID=6334 RepID=UPI0001EFCF36